MSNHHDVLIVGAGPVGLFMANELMRHGLNCKIIDKKSSLSTQSKALGIHIRTLEVFRDAGLIDDILARGHVVKGVLLKSRNKVLVDATMDQIDAPYHYLIDLPQDETEAVLYDHLQKKENTVAWKTELLDFVQNDKSIIATIKQADQESTITADWLVACDGSHSTVRHIANIDFVGSPYKEHWWLADLHIDWALPVDRVIIYFNAGGPTACFPMKNNRYRLVMAAPIGGSENPSFEEIKAYFAKCCPEPATLSEPIWVTGFNIHHRQIKQYRQQRIFFAGDAAHIHSPMGGQGMNTGIQDAYNLAWKLALVQKNIAPVELLESYHLERYAVGKQVVHDTDRMTKMAVLRNPLAIFLRNHVLAFIGSFSPIKNNIINNMAELTISYHKSPLVEQHGKLLIKAGTLIPNIDLQNIQNKTENLFDIVQGIKHHLFLLPGTENSLNMLEAKKISAYIQQYLADYLIVHLISVSPKPDDWYDKYWYDFNHGMRHKIGVKTSAVMLIRPDKYIAYLQTPFNADALLNYLAKIFIMDKAS